MQAQGPIRTPEDCIRAIAHTAGLVAMNLMEPARANAICSAYGRILQHHKAQASQGGMGLATADILNMGRKHPQLLGLLEPLLTDEQLELLMGQAAEEGDGQA